MTDFWTGKSVVVTGADGFLGSHLVQVLEKQDCKIFNPFSTYYDLRTIGKVKSMFRDAKPTDVIIHLAANVGGIGYNQEYPYSLFYDNAIMGIQIIHEAIKRGIKKFVQVGTVCAYPKNMPTGAFNVKNLWEGYPEETNAPYGLAKKMLLVQLQAARKQFDFNGIFLLVTNLYGPGDEFNPERSHVIPALIKKCIDAKERGDKGITVWGTGSPTRDFLYVGDAVRAILLAAEKYNSPEPLNIGSGRSVLISGLVQEVMEATGFQGEVNWDTSKPDGQPLRLLDSSVAKHELGWTATKTLKSGLRETVEWYLSQRESNA